MSGKNGVSQFLTFFFQRMKVKAKTYSQCMCVCKYVYAARKATIRRSLNAKYVQTLALLIPCMLSTDGLIRGRQNHSYENLQQFLLYLIIIFNYLWQPYGPSFLQSDWLIIGPYNTIRTTFFNFCRKSSVFQVSGVLA